METKTKLVGMQVLSNNNWHNSIQNQLYKVQMHKDKNTIQFSNTTVYWGGSTTKNFEIESS